MALKINFFLSGADFLGKVQNLERKLSTLGKVISSKGHGIGQFHLETELNREQVRAEIDALSLGGTITVEEEINDRREVELA